MNFKKISLLALSLIFFCPLVSSSAPVPTESSTTTTSNLSSTLQSPRYVIDSVKTEDDYYINQKINLSVRALEKSGVVATPENGFIVQAFLNKKNFSANPLQSAVVKYNKSSKRWDLSFDPVNLTGNYYVEVVLYCDNTTNSNCASKYSDGNKKKNINITLLEEEDIGYSKSLSINVNPRSIKSGESTTISWNNIGASYYIVSALCKDGVDFSGKDLADICVEGERVDATNRNKLSLGMFYPTSEKDTTVRVAVSAFTAKDKLIKKQSRSVKIFASDVAEKTEITLKDIPSEYDLSKEDIDFSWVPKDAVVDNIKIKSTDGSVNLGVHTKKVRDDDPITTGYYNLSEEYRSLTLAQFKGMLPEDKRYRFFVSGENVKEEQSRTFRIKYPSDGGDFPPNGGNQGDLSCKSFPRNLTIGSSGNDVTQLQKFLEKKGFLNMPNGVAYGYYGVLTQYALINYQKSKNISPAVGYFGPKTIAAVKADCLAIGDVNQNEIEVEVVSTTATLKDRNLPSDEVAGIYTIKFDVTAINQDIWIEDDHGVEIGDAVGYRVNGNEVYYGQNSSTVQSSSNTKTNNRWRIREGQTERFTLNVTLRPNSNSIGNAYGVGLNFLEYSSDSNGGNTETYYGFDEEFETSPIFLD